jgi:hypothetical protein
MADDPDDWLLGPWVYDDWLQEKLHRDKEWHKEHRAEAAKRRMLRMYPESKSLSPAPPSRDPVVREARLEEFKDSPKLRKWAVWKQYRTGGTTLSKVGEDFGIGVERTRQMVHQCERILRTALNRDILTFPAIDEVREATLGVEFVFRNDLTFTGWDGDQKGWEKLEPDSHDTSAYKNPVPWWKPEWGHQDTSPAKPEPAYTYYKTIIEKEQTDEDY